MNKSIQISAIVALSTFATAQYQSAQINASKRPAPRQLEVTRADPSKTLIEAPIKHGSWDAPTSTRKVAPGLVEWHTDLEAAKLAASRSGKPVMLFQLLGQLDQEFC